MVGPNDHQARKLPLGPAVGLQRNTRKPSDLGQIGFELSQQSRLTQKGGTQTLSSLLETAHGVCLEQD